MKIVKGVVANVIIAGAFAVHGIKTITQNRQSVNIVSAESIRSFKGQISDLALINLRQRTSVRM